MKPETALDILKAGPNGLPGILETANALRVTHFGQRVHLCSIINARSGACSEDCAYCAQSAHHDTEADIFDLQSSETIVASYRDASEQPISRFGIVTSGPALTEDSLDAIETMIKEYPSRGGVDWCSSLGCLAYEQLVQLREAGMSRFHHNLETAESFFSEICTTHTYAERLNTVRAAKKAGLEVCCGGILGMGESLEQRVEFALTLNHEEVDSIPLNFLVPVPGTRLGDRKPMEPLEILKSIAMFRMTNPTAEIKICAGRQYLRKLQSMIFYAGATGILVGPLLTVAGCNVEDDLQMIKDLELETDR